MDQLSLASQRAGAGATVRVTGTGMLMAAPTEARITVGVRSVQPSAQAAQAAATDVIRRVAQAIQALGVPPQQLQSTSVVLVPETRTDPTTNEVRTVGFRAEQTLAVTTSDLAQVGPIIDAAVAAGANVVENISFSVREPNQLQLVAIALASRDAQARALVLAQQFGLTLTGVRQVSTTVATPPIPLFAVQFAATPIFPGQQTIQASVDAEYTAAPRF